MQFSIDLLAVSPPLKLTVASHSGRARIFIREKAQLIYMAIFTGSVNLSGDGLSV
jgi:hypothetical protein